MKITFQVLKFIISVQWKQT